MSRLSSLPSIISGAIKDSLFIWWLGVQDSVGSCGYAVQLLISILLYLVAGYVCSMDLLMLAGFIAVVVPMAYLVMLPAFTGIVIAFYIVDFLREE